MTLGSKSVSRSAKPKAGTNGEPDAAARQDPGHRSAEGLLKASGMGSWVCDIASKKVTWSPELETMFGLEPGSFSGTEEGFIECIHPEDRERVLEVLERISSEAGKYEIEFRCRKANAVCWLLARGESLAGDDGKPHTLIGVALDITERKRTEQRVREIYELSSALCKTESLEEVFSCTMETLMRSLDADRVAILLFDPDGVMRFKAARGLSIGYKAKVEGHSPWKADTKDAEPVLIPDIEKVDLGELNKVVQKEGIRALGFFPLASGGRLLGKFMVYFNRTHEFQSEEVETAQVIAGHVVNAVEQSNASGTRNWLAAIVETSDDAIISKTLDGIITSWNSAAERMYGYTAEEAVGQSVTMLLPPERQKEEDDILRRLRRGESLDHFETIRLTKDGRRLDVSLTVSPVRDQNGKIVGASKSARDITAQKQSHRENKQLYEALKDSENRYRRLAETLTAADRRKDEFLATLAHELRNPLAPIRNSIQLLQMQGVKGSDLSVAHAIIDRQVMQMTRLVDDLMDVSRISQGRVRLRKEKIDLEEVVRTAIETARPVLEEARHELSVELPKLPILLDGDPVRLAQVIANLLNNAAKYTENGGSIRLSARRDGNEAVVTVADNGIGIATEHLPRVFEMFSQEAPALQRSQGGLGIGLSLVKGLVELHGGSVSAHSRGAGMGSEFEVRLPIVSRMRETADELDKGMLNGSSRCCKVLVVDDNRDHAESLGMLLELKGHVAETASDGQEGIDKAKKFHPEVILLDIGMPKQNGYECAQRIRQQPWGQDLVLVALTGWGQDQDKQMAMEAGFDHHLTKPVDPDSLERILAAVKAHG